MNGAANGRLEILRDRAVRCLTVLIFSFLAIALQTVAVWGDPPVDPCRPAPPPNPPDDCHCCGEVGSCAPGSTCSPASISKPRGEVHFFADPVTLPGVINWSHTLEYSSGLNGTDAQPYVGWNGERWMARAGDSISIKQTDTDEITVYFGTTSRRIFTDGDHDGTYTVPANYNATFVKTGSGVNQRYVLTELRAWRQNLSCVDPHAVTDDCGGEAEECLMNFRRAFPADA